MNVGIFGSGFGLYGYMPAVLALGYVPLMPVRYRDKLLSRHELCQFDSSVSWVKDETELFGHSDALIVALQPSLQVAVVRSSLAYPNIKRYLLEKPIGPTPTEAIELMQTLRVNGKNVQAGFNFRHTPWAQSLHTVIHDTGSHDRLCINWAFKAHHLEHGLDTWKRDPNSGGGVLSFYGIHVVALLAEWGYIHVHDSLLRELDQGQPVQWQATFSGPGLITCQVNVDACSESRIFQVTRLARARNEEWVCDLNDPFDQLTLVGEQDRRVALSAKVLKTLLDDRAVTPKWIDDSIYLWTACLGRGHS